jgi:tRNA threonylcarbamoyladenosine biosynthesis protein TsaE
LAIPRDSPKKETSSNILPMTTPADLTYRSRNEEATQDLGFAIGQVAEAGAMVALIGSLGAGKTRLVQGICRGLGVTGQVVNSPTFALIQEYQGRLSVAHFDTYRLRSVDEFLELGADEYWSGDGVCLIEWADRVAEVLPADRFSVTIEIDGPNSRAFRVSAGGPNSRAMLARLKATLDQS